MVAGEMVAKLIVVLGGPASPLCVLKSTEISQARLRVSHLATCERRKKICTQQIISNFYNCTSEDIYISLVKYVQW